jgi:TRAP transporter TAXI family solute receptor
MKKQISSLIFVSLALSVAFNALGQNSRPVVGIASGQSTGTNWPMAEDIKKVCASPAMQINNVTSDGSLDNIFKVYGDKSVQYSIIQEDALVYQQGLDPKMMSRIMMVFPFFSTEMHIIVKDSSPYKSLADLAGKRVVEGPEGSGTWVSTQVIKATTGLTWSALQMSQKDGLAAVQNGAADAEVIVAGMPVGLLKNATGVRLIPISHPKLDSFAYYTKTMIPNGTYPFMKSSVGTYKVDNVLATFAFKNQYQGEIASLVTCITKNMGRLQTEDGFHAKWRDVDPMDIERIQWPSHPAAKRAILNYAKRK